MQTNFRSIAICAIISLFLYAGKANATIKVPIADTICCAPDSLKVVSTNFPVFCVSWRVSIDSNCKSPYGFEIQWRQFPGSYSWNSRTVTYTGGTTINFCDSVSVCGGYQWRVRTICDTIGSTTYSNWIYGNKFSMTNCLDGNLNFTDDFKKKENAVNNRSTVPKQAIKPKED